MFIYNFMSVLLRFWKRSFLKARAKLQTFFQTTKKTAKNLRKFNTLRVKITF